MKKVTYDTLPEAVAELLERVVQIEKHLTEKATVLKHKKIKKSKTVKRKERDRQNKDMLTVDEASKLLNISVFSLYSYVKNKKIPFKKENRRLYFSKPELENWSKEKSERNQPNSDDTITVKEAEKLLNVPSTTLYYYIKSRKIPIVAKKGKKLFFSKQAITNAIRKEGKKNKNQTKEV
jgi:excisionase family DNA binding protein